MHERLAIERQITTTIDAVRPCDKVWVALSGGPDSMALLRLLADIRARLSAPLAAIHINHNLHPEARTWASYCATVCTELNVPLTVCNVELPNNTNVEEQARVARYQAIASIIECNQVVVTGHTLDDQAETLLLQLIRGAGPDGLAAMPAARRLGAGLLLRPLLGVQRGALHEFLSVPAVLDSANDDLRFDRNFIRHRVLTTLRERWPGVVKTLARAAVNQADASALLAELANDDLDTVAGSQPQTLDCGKLLALGSARRTNVIRTWVKRAGLSQLSRKHIEQIDTLLTARCDAQPVFQWPAGSIRRAHGLLYLVRPMTPIRDHNRIITRIDGSHQLAHGLLRISPCIGEGIKASVLESKTVILNFRQGPQRCRPQGRAHSQTLKKLFQEARVPVWLRERIPLIFVGESLVCVAGLWVCEPFAANPGEPGWCVSWTDESSVSR